MSRARRVVIAIGVVLVGLVVYGLIWSPRPTRAEKDRAAVEAVADRFTYQRVADAWAQSKIGKTHPMELIQNSFPFPSRGIREEGAAIILTFAGHNQTCVDFRTGPDGRIVSARHC